MSEPQNLERCHHAPHSGCTEPLLNGFSQDKIGRCKQSGKDFTDTSDLMILKRDVDIAVVALSCDRSVAAHLISHGSTYTRLWDLDTWKEHQSVKRYYWHVMLWHASTTAKMITPMVVCFSIWAGICVFLRVIGFPVKMPFTPLLLMGQAIALLLTLRTNQSLSRLNEAREACSKAIAAAREVGSVLDSYLMPHNPRAAIHIARHIMLYGWLLKAFVRGAEQQEVLETVRLLLDAEDARWVAAQPKPVLALVRQIRHIIARSSAQGELDRVAHRTLENQLGILNSVLGVCERIVGSPVPPTYTRHTSRVLLSFLLFVPPALLDMGFSAPVIILATMFITYVMIGIDEIGVEIEQPFQLLPLQQLAAELMEDVISEIASADPPPALLGEADDAH